jgi:NAD(P)H-hydrate epimerase
MSIKLDMKYALLTTEEISQIDHVTTEYGVSSIDLMEENGRIVANIVSAKFSQRQVSVLCGPGKNGRDGFVAARFLREWGWDVTLHILDDRENLSGEIAKAVQLWSDPIHVLTPAAGDNTLLIIDAIYGTGLSKEINGIIAALIRRVNKRSKSKLVSVIAIDMPSGVSSNTGEVRGVAFEASLTITFFRKKPGHILLPGRTLCGEVIVADIAIDDSVLLEVAPAIFENTPALWQASFPRPHLNLHKYKRGHALILSGGPLNTGAARLAARAAIRIGAGLVTIASPLNALVVNAAHLTSIMLRPCVNASMLSSILEDKRKNACLIGPSNGISHATRENVLVTLLSGTATVIDADALTSFIEMPYDLFTAIKRYWVGPVVLTPHEGEFKLLFPSLVGPKITRARTAAIEAGAIVVLKGADTIIASPEGLTVINSNAGPELATAGSGDVLAGIILGLLAQGLSAFEAAAAGVWFHGEAGQRFGPGLIADDLPELLPSVLRAFLTRI